MNSESNQKSDLKERIAAAVKKIGGQKAASLALGVSVRSISSYMTGDAEPKLLISTKLAELADVSLNWLATGKEPPESAVKYNPDAVDADLLKDVIELVDRELRWDNPEQKALICTKIYAYMTKKRANGLQKESEKAEIIDLMEILKSAG